MLLNFIMNIKIFEVICDIFCHAVIKNHLLMKIVGFHVNTVYQARVRLCFVGGGAASRSYDPLEMLSYPWPVGDDQAPGDPDCD